MSNKEIAEKLNHAVYMYTSNQQDRKSYHKMKKLKVRTEGK